MAGSSLAIFAISWALRDHPKVFPIYMMLWAGSRFVIEFFREPVGPSSGLSLAQIGCLGIVAVIGFGFIRTAKSRFTDRSQIITIQGVGDE